MVWTQTGPDSSNASASSFLNLLALSARDDISSMYSLGSGPIFCSGDTNLRFSWRDRTDGVVVGAIVGSLVASNDIVVELLLCAVLLDVLVWLLSTGRRLRIALVAIMMIQAMARTIIDKISTKPQGRSLLLLPLLVRAPSSLFSRSEVEVSSNEHVDSSCRLFFSARRRRIVWFIER